VCSLSVDTLVRFPCHEMPPPLWVGSATKSTPQFILLAMVLFYGFSRGSTRVPFVTCLVETESTSLLVRLGWLSTAWWTDEGPRLGSAMGGAGDGAGSSAGLVYWSECDLGLREGDMFAKSLSCAEPWGSTGHASPSPLMSGSSGPVLGNTPNLPVLVLGFVSVDGERRPQWPLAEPRGPGVLWSHQGEKRGQGKWLTLTGLFLGLLCRLEFYFNTGFPV
jgi:hypothetical protein